MNFFQDFPCNDLQGIFSLKSRKETEKTRKSLPHTHHCWGGSAPSLVLKDNEAIAMVFNSERF